METAARAVVRRTRSSPAPSAPVAAGRAPASKDGRQLPLPFVVPAPVTAALYLPDRWVDLDLRLGGAALPSSLPLALAKGARVLREVAGAAAAVAKAAPVMEVGMQTADLREYFVGASDVGVAGVLVLRRKDDGWTATLSKNLLPYVLSPSAVKAGEMPPPGTSALPRSLEAVIPRHHRYWEETSPESAKTARDALVAAGMFEDRLLKLVDGEIRLCVEQLYLYAPDGEAAASPAPTAKAATFVAREGDNALADIVAALLPPDKTPVSPFSQGQAKDAWPGELEKLARNPDHVLVLSPPFSPVAPLVAALIKAAPSAAWLVEHDEAHDPCAARDLARLGPVFKVAALPGRRFVASFLPTSPVTWVADEAPVVTPSPSPAAADEALVLGTLVQRFAHITKAGAEERYVLGVVLEPEVVDAQNDIYSPGEIAQSAHVFMEKFRTVGLMHKGSINDKVKILESYLAPVDFEVDGVPVKKGTWLMAVRVLDDDLWASVKEGGLTGFSIGGSSVRKPEPPATAN